MLGPTGAYPRGKLNEHDDGELNMLVSHDNGSVILRFGVPVAWVGMPPEQARGLAELLIKHAGEAEGGSGYVVEVEVEGD